MGKQERERQGKITSHVSYSLTYGQYKKDGGYKATLPFIHCLFLGHLMNASPVFTLFKLFLVCSIIKTLGWYTVK